MLKKVTDSILLRFYLYNCDLNVVLFHCQILVCNFLCLLKLIYLTSDNKAVRLLTP